MNEDIIDEDELDDPIRLFDFEQSRVCFSEFSRDNFEDPGFIIDISNDEIREYNEISSYRKEPSMLPVTFLNIDRNVKLLSECRSLCIRLIDCEKYPNFYKANEEIKQYNNDLNENKEELSSEEVIFINENIPKKTSIENMEKIDEKFIRHSENSTNYTIIQNNTEDGEKVIVSEEVSKRELYSEITQSESIYNLDTFARIIDKAYQKCVKSSTNIMSQSDHENTGINDNTCKLSKQSISIEELVNNALAVELETSKSTSTTSLPFVENQNIQSSIVNNEAHVTKNNNQITDSLPESMIAIKSNKIQVKENKNGNGSCSPILPCPLKSNNKTVQVTSNISLSSTQQHKNSNTICTKKIFSNKRVIPHYHEETLSNDINSTHMITKLSNNKKKEYATCRISNFNNKKLSSNIPSPKISSPNKCKISRTNLNNNGSVINRNLPLLNSSTTGICPLPCCLSHALTRQEINCNANVNDNEKLTIKDIKDKQFMKNLKENNKTLVHKKKPILLNQKPQVINQINSNFQYYPIQPIISSRPPNHHYYSIPQSSIKSFVEHKMSNNLPLPNNNSGIKFQTPALNTHTTKLLHPNILHQLTIQNEDINFQPKIPYNNTEEFVSENSKTLPITNNAVETISTVQRNRGQNISNLIYVPNVNTKSETPQNISVDIKNKNISKRYTHLIQALERPIEMNTHMSNIQNEQQRTHNNKQACDPSRQSNSANKGYSPPILPIPTYQKTFEVLSKIQYYYFQKLKRKDINVDQTPKPNPTKKRKMNDNKETVAKKITISEYKKRLDLPKSENNGKIKMLSEVSSKDNCHKEFLSEDLDTTITID